MARICFFAYADDEIMGESVNTTEKNTEALVIAGKGIDPEVNAKTTKYMATSPDQTARQNHNINTDNKSFDRVEQFKYLRTALTDQNSIQEKMKSRLNSGTAC